MCALLAAGLAGCAATSRVDQTVTQATLTDTKKAVVLMRIGAASPTCRHVAVLLGTPEGAGFRRHSVLQVAVVTSLVQPAVAETQLDAGTYHVVGYSCHDGKKPHAVTSPADPGFLFAPGTYQASHASFTVAAGDIVNVGYFHYAASRVGLNAFGRPVRTTVSVTDWPLAEIDRFKLKRPELYAKMVTRLMTVTPVGPQPATPADCTRLEAMVKEGKVQTLPPECRPQAAR